MRKTAGSPQRLDTIAPAHPLTERLVARLGDSPERRILEFASGGGRNARALRRAGFAVVTIDDRIAESPAPLTGISGRFAAILSTHGFLHGTAGTIGYRLKLLAQRLIPNGWLYATFGSTSDARCGKGKRVEEFTFVPTDGDERGVAHTFFDREHVCALLQPYFVLESLEEHRVDKVAGSWAHSQHPLAGAIHWFVIAVAKAE